MKPETEVGWTGLPARLGTLLAGTNYVLRKLNASRLFPILFVYFLWLGL